MKTEVDNEGVAFFKALFFGLFFGAAIWIAVAYAVVKLIKIWKG